MIGSVLAAELLMSRAISRQESGRGGQGPRATSRSALCLVAQSGSSVSFNQPEETLAFAAV